MIPQKTVGTGIRSFVEAVGSPPAAARKTVANLRKLKEGTGGFHPYQKILAELRRAVSDSDPEPRLAQAAAKAQGWRQRAFGEIADGFLQWRPTGSTGAMVPRTDWKTRGLRLTLDFLLGVILADGTRLLVLPYVKEEPLCDAKAEAGLRVLHDAGPGLMPDAQPMVLEVRHGREHMLPDDFDAASNEHVLRVLADRYLELWSEAA